jgi:hypothetical protein
LPVEAGAQFCDEIDLASVPFVLKFGFTDEPTAGRVLFFETRKQGLGVRR